MSPESSITARVLTRLKICARTPAHCIRCAAGHGTTILRSEGKVLTLRDPVQMLLRAVQGTSACSSSRGYSLTHWPVYKYNSPFVVRRCIHIHGRACARWFYHELAARDLHRRTNPSLAGCTVPCRPFRHAGSNPFTPPTTCAGFGGRRVCCRALDLSDRCAPGTRWPPPRPGICRNIESILYMHSNIP